MIWNEPADAQASNSQLEAKLWDSANHLWANAALKPAEYSPIVLVDDPRYPFGLPRTDNANYLWIQQFYSSLKPKPSTGSGQGGRAGFVMANSASDARASEQDIRQKLIESGAVDVLVAIGPNSSTP